MTWNTLDTGLKLFFSREVTGRVREKTWSRSRTPSMGPDASRGEEPMAYGYEAENRHFVRAFRG